jgi:tetratricopeptide (TPR) repeat protein
VRARLAQILAAGGRLDEGRAVLEQARQLSGATPELSQILGDLLADAERLEGALQAYREGIALAPDSVPLRLREADLLLRQGDLEQGSQRIRVLLDEHPEDPSVELAHIRSLALAARSDEAIEKLRALLAREPENPRAHFLLGTLWMEKNRPSTALGSLEVAANGLSGDEGLAARKLLAQAHLQIGDLMVAVNLAERALAEDPADLQIRLVLANALLEGGLPDRAEAVLDAASGPESAPVQAARARVFVRTGRLAQAQAAIERAVALEPDSVQWVVDLVWVLRERGEVDTALRLVRSRMLAQPDEPEYPNLIGQILLRQEDLVGAERAFRQTLEVDPNFVHGYLNLIYLAQRAERFEEVRQLYQQALAQRPNDARVLREFGEFEYNRGRTDTAIEAFEASLRADPSSAVTSADLGRALSDVGRDLPRALELVRIARAQDPGNADFAEALARVLHSSGLHAAAVAQYREGIALAPHPIAAYHYRLGVALDEGGEPEEAARELQEALEIDASFAGADDARRRLAALGPPAQ